MISEYEQALKLQKITVGLKNSWTDFRKGFNAWKAKDNKAMIDGLIEHFMQLEQLWSSVKENIDAESQWRPKIEKQQRLIRSKIQRIGGRSALARLALEVRKFRPSDSGTNINVLPESNSGHESKNSVLNSSYEFFPSSNEASADVVNDLKKFGSFLSNEQLAHELIMDPNFELGRDSKTEMEKQITEVVKRAYFDKIRQDLTDNKIESTLMVIEDIRGQILSMVNEKGSMHRKIAAELDLVVIKQQIEQGIFAWKEYLQHACSIMLQLCAPARDQRIRAILENGDVVESVREIFEALEMMKLDLANFRLQSLRPVLMQQAAEYERAKFEHALSNGQVSLENAAKWIQASVNKAKEVSTARNPENVELPGNNVKFENVYIDALLSTIFSSEPIDAECFPETLSMDYARISSFQNEAQAIAVVAALLMLSRNLSADFRDDFNAVQTLKEQLFLFLQDADTSIDNLAHLIISSISKVLAQSNKSLTEEQKDMVRNMVDKTMSYRDTVFSLLHRRIMNEVRVHLVSGRFRKDTNNGLDVVIQEVEGLSGKIFRLVSHNRSVYAKWYDEMIRQAMNA